MLPLFCFFSCFLYTTDIVFLSMSATVTIVGRPNVGKSSLFNALTGHKIAIVSDIENTTRDIIEYLSSDSENGMSYVLSDSGGLVFGSDESLLQDVRERVKQAIENSDLILFVLEYDRITELDEMIARELRRSKKPIIVIGNKADNASRALEGHILGSLGLGEIVLVSPVQRRGIETLRSRITTELQSLGFSRQE